MRYKILKDDATGKYNVLKATGGKAIGSYDTVGEARDQMHALHAADPETGKVVWMGGQIKALDDNGRIGGYGILFTGESDPDLGRDYFKGSTNYFLDPDEEGSALLLFHHGLDPDIKARRLGKATVKVDKVGVWVEGILAMRDEYEKAILELVKAGKLGWSTGSAPHLVERKCIGHDYDEENREACKGLVHEITQWPIMEASITPVPFEPRTQVQELKAYVAQILAEDEDALKSTWSQSYRDSLPDEAFAHVSGDVRMFPYRDRDGRPDPVQIKTALDAIPGSSVSDAAKRAALGVVKAAARKIGVEATTIGKSLHDRLSRRVELMVEDGQDRSAVIKSMADEALVTEHRIEQVLAGAERPSAPELKGIAGALGVDYEVLKALNLPPKDAPLGVKGVFEDELSSREHRTWDLWSALSCVVSKLVNAAVGNKIAGVEFDLHEKLKEALGEYSDRLVEVVIAQADEFMQSEYTDQTFYLKALGDPRAEDFVSAKNFSADDHLSLAVSAAESVHARVRANVTPRLKAGRKLSAKNYRTFRAHFEEQKAKAQAGIDMLEEFKPDAGADRKAMESKFLRDSHRATQALLDAVE